MRVALFLLRYLTMKFLVPPVGLEPTTPDSSDLRSTNWSYSGINLVATVGFKPTTYRVILVGDSGNDPLSVPYQDTANPSQLIS
jgi:hypothetical protein